MAAPLTINHKRSALSHQPLFRPQCIGRVSKVRTDHGFSVKALRQAVDYAQRELEIEPGCPPKQSKAVAEILKKHAGPHDGPAQTGLRLTLTTTGRSWFTGDPTSDSSGRIAAVPNLPNDDATIGPSLAGTRLANTPGGGARTPASRRLAPGSLHRDLKPANVMIDGDGNVRITDFGLAGAAGDAAAVRAGTPQYMAPEQLAGQPASIRSDIYALGLVLFEIFTGRRVYEAKTLGELKQLHDTGTITTPSAIVRDLDPAIERVVLRCLERDPDRRPASALAVAAALPGGDPLAAALAAGETPSPDMLAAAGETDAIGIRRGVAAVAFVAVVIAALSPRASIAGRVP